VKARLRLLCLLAALAAPHTVTAADAIDELPPAWSDTLLAVPESDVTGTERIAREAIARTRARLSELLRNGAAAPSELAEGYAELAALYQLFQIDAPAAACWDNARRLQPDEFRWSYYAGYLALTRGESDAALDLLEAARRLDPDYPPLDLRMGQLWLDVNELDKARGALDKAAAQPGLRAAALYYLGQIDLLERDYEGAKSHLEEALAIDPQALGVHYPLAQAYRHLGDDERARQHLAHVESKPPAADDPLVTELQSVLETSRTEFGLGLKAVEAQDFEGAVAHFRAGLEIDPDNLAARVSYARVLYLAGDTDAAAQQLQQVLARDPEQILATFLLAVLADAGNAPDAAAGRYRSVLALDPGHEGASFYLANLLFREDRFAQAADQYAATLAANRDVPPARLLEMVARHRAGAPDRVVAAELERRVKAYPEQPELSYALIRLLCLSADATVRDSVRALRLANALAPSQPTPPNIAVLALAAAADGQYEQAADLQQRVVDMLVWGAPPGQAEAMRAALESYRSKRMPAQPIWPQNDPLLNPPPLNPGDPFRYYPAAVPF
jgi:tetratricopeptide (TPR) repeat protein